MRAHLAALLRLCPEERPAAWEASETSLKTERRLLAELVAAPDPATLAWLVLGDSLSWSVPVLLAGPRTPDSIIDQLADSLA